MIAANRSIRHIRFDHSRCHTLGLCASTIMDVLLIQARRRRPARNRLSCGGIYSKTPSVNLMLRASGVLRHLGLQESALDAETERQIVRCELFSGKASKIEVAKKREMAATQLTTYFDRCLGPLGFSLSKRGQNHLSQLLTEVIGNAEEHGGPWYTIGHCHLTKSEDQPLAECHIVIFNFGTTIYESLKLHSQSEKLRSNLSRLSEFHSNQGYFNFARTSWDEEVLWTLYALQERVSRYSDTPRGRDRGNGSISMIEFFDSLAGDSSKMCITSGRGYILFNGKYHLQPVKRDGETLKIIAFNDDNDLMRPPKRDNVRRLEALFPGTIVSIRLTLKASHLASLAQSEQESNDNEQHNSRPE